MRARLLAGLMAAIVVLSALLGCTSESEPIDPQPLIATAVALQDQMLAMEYDRNAAYWQWENVWDKVEKGPQLRLNIQLDRADRYEARGWIIEAKRTRETSYATFNDHPDVLAADKLRHKYLTLDQQCLEVDDQFGKVAAEIEALGASDLLIDALIEGH